MYRNVPSGCTVNRRRLRYRTFAARALGSSAHQSDDRKPEIVNGCGPESEPRASARAEFLRECGSSHRNLPVWWSLPAIALPATAVCSVRPGPRSRSLDVATFRPVRIKLRIRVHARAGRAHWLRPEGRLDGRCGPREPPAFQVGARRSLLACAERFGATLHRWPPSKPPSSEPMFFKIRLGRGREREREREYDAAP